VLLVEVWEERGRRFLGEGVDGGDGGGGEGVTPGWMGVGEGSEMLASGGAVRGWKGGGGLVYYYHKRGNRRAISCHELIKGEMVEVAVAVGEMGFDWD